MSPVQVHLKDIAIARVHKNSELVYVLGWQIFGAFSCKLKKNDI